MLTELAAGRPAGVWRFPGHYPDQPAAYTAMHRRLREVGGGTWSRYAARP